MNNRSYIGVVDKIRVLTSFPDMLVRFTLHTSKGDINCLVANKQIANKMLFLDENKYQVSTFGHYNNRKQFVVQKLAIRNPDSFVREFVVKPLAKF